MSLEQTINDDLKAATAELARQRAHAEIAMHQSGDELTSTRAELAASAGRVASLEREVETLRSSLEVASAAAAEEVSTRLDAAGAVLLVC